MIRRRLTAAALFAATLVGVAAPVAAAGGRDTDPVREQVDRLVEQDGVPGALAFTGDATYRAGTAESGTDRPMVGADGRVRIASNSKSFTSVAVMRLILDGRLGLGDRAGAYVPRLAGSEVTVRELLAQRSGLPEYVGLMDWTAVDSTPEDHLALALSQEPLFEPGTDWAYSNTNYLVLGMIIESVTGDDFRTYVEDTVIEPLGLDATYWPEPGETALRGPHAHNYGVSPADPEAGPTDLTELPGHLFGAAGGLVSTPEDLNAFWEALFDGELLPRWAVWLMTHDASTVGGDGVHPEDTRYGYGIASFPLSCGGRYYGHGGDLPGDTVLGGHLPGSRAAGSRTVTVYTTTMAMPGDTRTHLQETVDTALCADGR
ncbi:serine hydrolase domain-containing protein [Streptomyces hainanensis]|uniref:Class A beta-lactamase-related serine hydrolase n=1 Tax=Streptomyces hainanensis TaxID=402648 RepID=A0A4R4TPM6_9ACTN|nr:serine hydrolase domain-containing protein [Streptomyces hainanensis]TDC80178.1 class A beta-lactamase-related serine hydrolase [Streptomyces hainanensis]